MRKESSNENSKEIETLRKNPQLQHRLRSLSQLKPSRTIVAFVFDWSVIAGAVTLTELNFSVPLYVVAVLIVASRQHALLVLMHEGSHQRILKNARWNDLISDVFAAFPLLVGTDEYRKHHLQHHRHLNTDQDPDWVRKAKQPVWQFPRAKTLIYKDAFAAFVRGGPEWLQIGRYFSRPRASRFVFWAVALGAIAFTGSFTLVALYWFVPLLAVFPTVQRIRSIAEHFGLPRSNDLDSSRNVLAPAAELFFFGPHGVNYHLDHHLFPSVPFYNLKKLNAALMDIPEYRDGAHQNTSYIWPNGKSVLQDLEHAKTPNGSEEKAA